MHQLLSFSVIVLLFVVVRAGDIAISSSVARDVLRAVLYGLVALLALIALVLVLIH